VRERETETRTHTNLGDVFVGELEEEEAHRDIG